MAFDFHARGVPRIDAERCIVCGECVAVCPDSVLRFEDDATSPAAGGTPPPGAERRAGEPPRPVDGELLGCIACGQCAAVCPTEAITVTGRGMRPDDPVPLPECSPASYDQLAALLSRRRSVRRFTERAVSRETLERILELATTAPMGIPPSDVGVVVFDTREKVRQFVGEACRVFGRQARMFNPVVLALMRPLLGKHGATMMRQFVRPLLQMLAEKHAAGEDRFLYGAPAAMIFHHSPLSGQDDCHIVATYAMLAAESLGLGTCLIGTVAALNHDKPLRAKLGIPAENRVGLGLILGYPDVKFHRTIRRRLASVVFR